MLLLVSLQESVLITLLPNDKAPIINMILVEHEQQTRATTLDGERHMTRERARHTLPRRFHANANRLQVILVPGTNNTILTVSAVFEETAVLLESSEPNKVTGALAERGRDRSTTRTKSYYDLLTNIQSHTY